MKKYFLSVATSIICLVAPTCTTFAQTTSTPPATAPKAQPSTTVSPKTSPTVAPPNPLAEIEQNIDRRLMYFNRYKSSEDRESIAKLVSVEKRDFSINFMKYVEAAPIFTIKRDSSAKTIKTPLNEYIITVRVTMGKVEKKAAMTFIEEKTDRGTKWSISDSNIHIQMPLPAGSVKNETAPTGPNIPPAKGTDTPVPESEPKKDENIPPVTEPVAIPPTPEPAPNQGLGSSALGNTTPNTITIGSPIVIVSLILFGILLGVIMIVFFAKKRGNKKRALAAAAAVVASSVVDSTIPATEASTTPLDNSNATLKTIEDIHTTPGTIAEVSSTPVATVTATELSETPLITSIPVENAPEISAEVPSTPLAPEVSIPEVPFEAPRTFTDPSLSLPSAPVLQEAIEAQSDVTQTEKDDELLPLNSENTSQDGSETSLSESETLTLNEPQIQPIDTSVPSLNSYETTVQDPEFDSSHTDTSTQPLSLNDVITHSATTEEAPHSLFDTILNDQPAKPASQGLFDTILNPES